MSTRSKIDHVDCPQRDSVKRSARKARSGQDSRHGPPAARLKRTHRFFGGAEAEPPSGRRSTQTTGRSGLSQRLNRTEYVNRSRDCWRGARVVGGDCYRGEMAGFGSDTNAEVL